MKKKKLIILSGIVFLFAIIASSAIWYYLTKDVRERAIAVAQMPPFSGRDAEGTLITNKELERGRGILLFITPGCSFCQQEISEIRDNISAFKNYPVYLVSTHEAIHGAFADDFELNNVSGLHLLLTDRETFRNFQVMAVPQAFIYYPGGILKERIEGYTPVEDLVDYL